MEQTVKKSSILKKFKNIVLLQIIFILYTFVGIAAKLASSYAFLSPKYISFYVVEIFLLGVYAILWQQIIKRFSLSIAYSNKGLSIIWSLIWSYMIFSEKITVYNLIGSMIIIIGIVVVNKDV